MGRGGGLGDGVKPSGVKGPKGVHGARERIGCLETLGRASERRWERQRLGHRGEGSTNPKRARRVRILGAEKAPVSEVRRIVIG